MIEQIEVITKGLVSLEVIGKEMYGRRVDRPLVEVWQKAMRRRGVTLDEFAEGIDHWLAFESKFPEPARFFDWVLQQRRETHILIGQSCEDGATVRVVSVPIKPQSQRSAQADHAQTI